MANVSKLMMTGLSLKQVLHTTAVIMRAHMHTHTYDVSHGGIVDRIPAVKRFSVPVQTGPQTQKTVVQTVSGLFRRKSGRSAVMITHFHLAPGCEWVGATPLLFRCARIGMSWGDLYLYCNVT